MAGAGQGQRRWPWLCDGVTGRSVLRSSLSGRRHCPPAAGRRLDQGVRRARAIHVRSVGNWHGRGRSDAADRVGAGYGGRHLSLATAAVLQRGLDHDHPRKAPSTPLTASTTSAGRRSAPRSSVWRRSIPDNSLGFGLNIVTVPGGRSVHVDARIGLASLSGPWTDSSGNSGSFIFGAATGGSPRPTPTIPAAMIRARLRHGGTDQPGAGAGARERRLRQRASVAWGQPRWHGGVHQCFHHGGRPARGRGWTYFARHRPRRQSRHQPLGQHRTRATPHGLRQPGVHRGQRVRIDRRRARRICQRRGALFLVRDRRRRAPDHQLSRRHRRRVEGHALRQLPAVQGGRQLRVDHGGRSGRSGRRVQFPGDRRRWTARGQSLGQHRPGAARHALRQRCLHDRQHLHHRGRPVRIRRIGTPRSRSAPTACPSSATTTPRSTPCG